MIQVQLLPHAEKLAPENPLNLARHPLLHQMRTYRALQNFPVVMNTYNTGTGKTVASLLHLFDLRGQNVLFIAPINALLAQHAEDIETFVRQYDLDFEVLRVTAAQIRQLDPQQRPGSALHHLILNYLRYRPREVRRKPIIMVVNPDIFYYALFARYHQHDQRNLMEDFILRFDYIVIDEFHYYDSKQLANFLFVMAMFDQFGYFEHTDRRICLLSATPLPYVSDYLQELFGSHWRIIAPDNENPEDAGLPTIPSLAPLELRLQASTLEDWLQENRELLRAWLDAGWDGAIISNSLWRINWAWRQLAPRLGEARLGRITGPEPEASRRFATARSLILASPTVDIGYNFAKRHKDRQNIDFLVCDARYRDGLLQRLGRAGRVLGKSQTHLPSQAVALLPEEAISQLSHLDGQTLTRSEFNAFVNSCEALPPKHDLTGYIHTYGIIENFYPIFKLGAILPPSLHKELESLFQRIKTIFAPRSRRTYKDLKSFYFKYQRREQWLQEVKTRGLMLNRATAEHVCDWLAWRHPGEVRYDADDLLPLLPQVFDQEEQHRQLIAFVQSQVAVMRTCFHFRDSFNGPSATVYDTRHLLSSEDFNTYELFHLLTHYRLGYLTAQTFLSLLPNGQPLPETDFYVQIQDWRDEKLVIRFALHSSETQTEFERLWCFEPVGLQGLELRAGLRGQGTLAGALPPAVVHALRDEVIVSLILPPRIGGLAARRLRGTPLWSRSLHIYFSDGELQEGYRIFFGKAALMAYAELAPLLYAHRNTPARDPIIL